MKLIIFFSAEIQGNGVCSIFAIWDFRLFNRLAKRPQLAGEVLSAGGFLNSAAAFYWIDISFFTEFIRKLIERG